MNIFAQTVLRRLKFRIHVSSSYVRSYSGAYDAPAQTTTTIVNRKEVKLNMIETYSQIGFRLTNNAFLLGPTIILPDKVFHWYIDGDEEINAKSLEFFFHLHPPLDILIIGLSDLSFKPKIEKEVFINCRKNKVQVEILSTPKAVATFNFLVEIRKVAGAFIPPAEFVFDEADIIEHKQRLGISDGRDQSKPDVIPMRFPKTRRKD
ncbi:hypothetical protein V9T40_014101 [Parthenolecanium corni]|uniref:NADH dehydrogenase [ubiquinone] 1 alpha subcomplex assembly factor 3 n=1 Tax=Parthenolecanium corni TaxID=536013 RepID=A0AAN9Y3A1_9HEMI